jgi:hypothetical protein
MIGVYSLDTTYNIQFFGRNGEWNWHSQSEYATEAEVHELGRSAYGGQLPYRVVTITRTVGEAVDPE